MSVANLKALGFSAEEARRVHYTAAARIHELFENAEDGFFEEAYKQDASKAGAYHFFNTVDIEGIGAFDVNVTAIRYVKEQEGNVLYTLELTIENPATRGAASREGRLPTPFKDGVSTRNLSSYRSFVEKEKASIKKKAVADGTFMKAPNGKDTNLTEDQWLSVRTEAFKNWFGDWEHDPENASKVVDENGEPLAVYHYTDYEGNVLRTTNDYGMGALHFYTSNRDGKPAESQKYYGSREIAAFLNFRNPQIIDAQGNYYDNISYNGRSYDTYGIAADARKLGFDGVIINNVREFGGADIGTDWLAFNPTQIKSSTNNRGTFDPKNPDITFSINTKKLDREYLDAVEKGDMEKAQRMVNEFARAKGYVVDDSWKMDHRAPSKSGDTPQERQKNGEVSLLDMADGFGIIPEEMILDSSRNLELGWDNAHMDALFAVRSAMKQRRSLVEKGKNNKIPAIAMYRAVPRDIKEGDFRGGDWVTPSMEYAREHGESNLDGKYRIISHRVYIKDVYWNGDDICEWGYDDGVNYAYRNTKNNRKLLDPVTYDLVEVRDENGEYEGHDLGEWDSEKKKFSLIPYRFNYEERVIPLSKRFNFKNPDVSFSVIGPNAATWGKYADKAFAGRDDGKLRAEIDASKAGVRCGVLQKDKPVKLGELLDFAELYEAYPDAKDITVVLEDKTVKDAGGYFSPWRNAIHLFTNRTKGADSLKSGLLHEVQHWIQHKEGFINGISPSSARAGMFSALIKKGYLGDRLRWINTPEFARDELERIARLMRRPAAIKKMGEKYEVQEVMDIGIMAQQAIELLAKNYRLRQLSDAADFRTRNRGNSPLPVLPEKFMLKDVQERIQAIEQMEKRYKRGERQQLSRELEKLHSITRYRDYSSEALYLINEGELEARAVEVRARMGEKERQEESFQKTKERLKDLIDKDSGMEDAYPQGFFDSFEGEATFSVRTAQEQGLFHDGHFEAGNAVITEPGVTFSIAALHASPHSFRKFSTDFMGKGEGAQAYGWGLYFAESEKVNRDYMNWFAQDNATWKFGDVETSNMEVMHQALDDRLLPKDALPEVKEDASDMIWTVLGDLSDARGDERKIEAIKKELREDIQHSMEYGRTYHQTLEKMVQLHGVYRSLIDLLDEIEVRPGMPSNYKVELNVDDSELMGWDYVDETVLALLKDSPVEEVRYALERAERRADYRGENVSGKDVYQELFDAFWDGEDGTKQEAQKAASVSLLSSDIKGIRYADGYTRGKAEEEQTYNYVIFDGNDIKITAFADESTGGAWADYEDPTATFSIIGEKAESFMEYHNNGLSYTDPADGKRKAIIDSRGVRLRKEHVSVSEGGHVNVSLAAALDFPELFRAYPELRKLRVDFYRDSRSGTGGFTDPQEHYIAVNVARGGKNAAPGMVLDTILHEVQHVIQGYEGFAQGAGRMSRDQALAYLGESMIQLAGRDDAWAKEALPRLERMRQELEAGTLQPAFVYVFSHGEQEARLAGRFEKNSEGVVMSGLNGFRLLDAPQFSIPLTGNITELGGITFGAGRFGRMADRVLAPNGDWLYDEMVFRMRAAAQRSVSKLRLFETGDRERGLELLAEAQELISTVERYLPGSYGFGLEPYKIWLNVFSLLYGNSGKMAPDEALSSALSAIPMEKWPEIMAGSVMKHFWGYVKQHETLGPMWEGKMKEFEEEAKFAEAGEKAAELDKRRWEFFIANGAEFLEKYGQVKVYRLISKFMARVVEQIDRYRKDRTLGRIRRVAASVAPRTNPQGKPLRGKMDAESYRRLEDRLRLMEMTPAQYDAFFRKNFPEVLDEEAAGQQEGRTLWEDVKPQDPVTVETTDAEGGALALTVTKATFEAYACYEKMNVETAENAARALGEFISTKREAWENAAESKKNEIEDLLRPVLEAAGRTDDQAMATHRKQARLKTLPSGPMSLTGYLLNFSQYMQGLQSVPAFRGIAKKFERRAARFAVQKQACEKDTLAFVKKAAGRILQTEDEYEIADWIYEQRRGLDTGLTVTEQEPDWQGKAREEYRAGVLNLIRRKVRKRGAARTLAHVAFLMKDMDAELKAEIERVWPDARDEVWSEKDAAVFTEKELDRYGSQEKYVEEHAARARKASKWGKGKSPYQAQSYKLDHISRMEAAYIILLSQQEDYQEMLRLKGFTQEILEGLEQFAGSEVMEFSRALREKLNERGQEVKEVTESRYGAPFPMIENYFRAFFDVGIEAIDQSIMDAASYGDAATGGKFGLIHARKKHHASLDLSIDVLTAYYAAMNEQDVYLYGSEISRDMRALINYRGENGTRGARSGEGYWTGRA